MAAKIQKWGNSLAIRLPKYLTDAVNLKENDPVSIKIEKNAILILPAYKNEYDLNDLVDTITEKNIHAETDSGIPLGAEKW